MATGSGIPQQRGPITSDITPQVALPATGDDFDRMAATFDRLNNNVFRPMLARRAAALGAQEGTEIAAGERDYRPLLAFGSVADAREAALEAAYLARTRGDIDAAEGELRRAHPNDPGAYRQAADAEINGFLRGAPPQFAAQVEAYARDRYDGGFQSIADARSLRDRQESAQALAVRAETLAERLIALGGRAGGMDSPEYAAALEEYDAIQQMRADNPDILYSPEQRAHDDAEMETGVLTARVSGLAVEAYGEGGRGLAGYAAGVRFLESEVLEGEAFSDLTPEQRQRVFRDARAHLNDYAAADREQARAEAEEERRRREEERDVVASALLDIELGELSRDEIMAMDGLSDAGRDRLLRSVRVRDERAADDARRDATVASVAAYQELYGEASAGGLTNGEIAAALSAGTINETQARTLRGVNSATLRPVIEDVMAPVEDYANRPGMRSRGSAEVMARAHAEAARWAAANPDATLEQRLAQGRIIAERVFGQQMQGEGGQGGATGQAARLRALEEQRRQGRINQTEYERRRREILNGD